MSNQGQTLWELLLFLSHIDPHSCVYLHAEGCACSHMCAFLIEHSKVHVLLLKVFLRLERFLQSSSQICLWIIKLIQFLKKSNYFICLMSMSLRRDGLQILKRKEKKSMFSHRSWTIQSPLPCVEVSVLAARIYRWITTRRWINDWINETPNYSFHHHLVSSQALCSLLILHVPIYFCPSAVPLDSLNRSLPAFHFISHPVLFSWSSPLLYILHFLIQVQFK